MSIPIEITAIHDAAANLRGMSVHIFGSRMGHDVSTPLKGTTVDGRREGIIDNQGHTMLVGNASELFDIQHLTARVRDGLAKQCLGIRTEGRTDLLLRRLWIHKRTLDTQFFQRHAKEVVGATINLV